MPHTNRPLRGRRRTPYSSKTDERVVGQVQHDALVLQAWRTKIQQQTSAATRGAKIVDQLRRFTGTDGVQGFQFYQDLAIADEIDRVGPDGLPSLRR